jgi:MoaA/NifB/PqqE/SkfB family radical SAM enzyme
MRLTMDKPSKLYLQVTNTCHLNCYQCYTRCTERPTEKDFTYDEWMSFVDYLIEHEFMQVHFEGGEPLRWPGFLDLVRKASQDMLVWFRTHATDIDDDLAREIKAARAGRVVVDVFAAQAETHDYLAGVPGSYEKTLAGIRNLRRAGVAVVMVMILNRLNLSQLQEYVDLAGHLGVREVGFLRLYPIGRARDRWRELAAPLGGIMDSLRRVRVPTGMRLMQGFHPYDSNCCWENAGVTSAGDSIGCPYLRESVNYGNIRETPFLRTWDHPLYRQLREQEIDGACPDCTSNQQLSPGGCRASAFAFTGRWDAPDPFCTATNHGIDLTGQPVRAQR